MFTLAEMTAWSNDDISTHIQVLMAKDLSFRHGYDQGERMWYVRFECFDEGAKKQVVVWSDYGADQRMVLFNAFGWVWARQQPEPDKHSPWARRRHQDLREVISTGGAQRPGRVPDPADLDPTEVASVYEASTNSDKNRR